MPTDRSPATEPDDAADVRFASVVARLRAAGCVFAEDEAALLLAADDDDAAVDVLVGRRAGGEPLEQVLGWAAFAGLRVLVEPGVFVPRRRTELLVRQALPLLGPRHVLVDLCCGTGAVGAALAAAVPDVELHACDVDPAAVRCARRNLEPLGGRVHAGDLVAALPPSLRGRVDVLVVNAPYVPTDAIALMPPEARLHEPAVALDGGDDGLAVHRRVASEVVAWLAPGGHLLLETSVDQADRTAALLRAAGLDVHVVHDDDLDGTVAVGVRRTDGR